MPDLHSEFLLSDAHATETLGAALARTYVDGGPISIDGARDTGGHGKTGGSVDTGTRDMGGRVTSGRDLAGQGNSGIGGGDTGGDTGGDPRGQPGAVVFLRGELGAGKTTCVRSLLRTLGVDGLIRSPTYTLVEVYEPQGILCVHVDLYRLRGPLDVEELGLRDYLDGQCLLLVEWPEKGVAALPRADLDLTLAYWESGRRASAAAPTVRGSQWLEMLVKDASLAPYVSN